VKRLVQVGIRDLGEAEAELIETHDDQIATFYDADLAEEKLDGTPWNRLVDRVVAKLPEQVYLSFDIDGWTRRCAPTPGRRVPGGLSFQERWR